MLTLFNSFSLSKILSGVALTLVVGTTAVSGVMVYQKLAPPQTSELTELSTPTAEELASPEWTGQDATTVTTTGQTIGESALVAEPGNATAQTDPTQPTDPVPVTEPTATSSITTAQSNRTSTNTSTSSIQVSSTSSSTFDQNSLAQYDGRNGACYIAFRGTVYNVTGHPSWRNCSHHGALGGRDITSIFPHPLSQLNGISTVGTYSTQAQTSGNTTTTAPVSPNPVITNDEDGEARDEIEDHSEVEEDEDHEQEDEDHEQEDHEDEEEVSLFNQIWLQEVIRA